MVYCAGCGKALEEAVKFCSECGMPAAGTQTTTPFSAAVPPAQAIRVFVLEPKRGGWLAFKGFALVFILDVVFGAATKYDKSEEAVGMLIGFGVGAAYIIFNLRNWKKSNAVVKGERICWAVVGVLLLMCLGILMKSGSIPINSTHSLDPKDTLLREVDLDFNWRTEGFGNVMIADFTLKNPTQYSFKDFEIKCTHVAPSGTVIDTNTQTIYEIVGPKSTKVIKHMNMGFIHSQALRSSCKVIDLVPLQ
jgi:hypothetical protein